jgi:hypothetical protein
LLEGNVIVPEETMEAEIAHRVRCWTLDTTGRREFFFTVERKVRRILI